MPRSDAACCGLKVAKAVVGCDTTRFCDSRVRVDNAIRKRRLRGVIARRGTMTPLHEASCACCSGLGSILDRRHFVRALAVGGATLAFAPRLALSAEGNYEAMVLACIDPRIQEPVHRYTIEQNLTGKLSQFDIAGAAIGVDAPAFKQWHKAFWDNLATTIELHRLMKGIATDHPHCGATQECAGAATAEIGEREFARGQKAQATCLRSPTRSPDRSSTPAGLPRRRANRNRTRAPHG